MIKNRATEVIKTFSPEELKSFELFINSPFHNSNKSLVKLLALIKKYWDRMDEDKITEEFFYMKIFPGKKYSYGNMKNMVSELFGLCEDFLAITPVISVKAYAFEQGLRRLDNYNMRSLDKLFFAEYKHLEGYLETHLEYSVLSSDFYLNKSRLLEKLYKFYTRRSQYTGALDTLYPMSICNTCQIISTLKNDVAGIEYLKSQINYVPDVNPTEALYRTFDSASFLKEISGLEPVYYEHITLDIKLMKLYNEPHNWENYVELKEFILKNISRFSNAERWHLTSGLFSFVINMYIEKSTRELLQEISLIRKIQLANVKFNTDGLGPLQAGVFRNMVEVFVILGEIDYAENFINSYIQELEEDKRKSVYSTCMAIIEESRGNNEKVLELLHDVEFSDYQVKYSAKMIALVAYYNLGFVEQGLSAADSMKHFVKNTEEFSPAMKLNLSSRVSVIEKLFKIRANPEKYSEDDIKTLHADIDNCIVSRKEWYIEKAEELRSQVQIISGMSKNTRTSNP
jgi:hypothetical protein